MFVMSLFTSPCSDVTWEFGQKKDMEDSSPAVKVPVGRMALPEDWHFPPAAAKMEVMSPSWLWGYLHCSIAAPCLSAKKNASSHCPAWSTQVPEVVTHIIHTDAVQTKQRVHVSVS